MDSFYHTDTNDPLDSSPMSLSLNCPDCGNPLVIPENASYLTCTQCGEDHLIGTSDGQIYLSPLFPGLDGEIPTGDWRIPAMTIHQLKAEVKDLEGQLETLTREGSLIDLARKTGFTVIFAGLGFTIANGAATLPALPYGFVGLLSGVLLHGGSRLIGRNYFTQKAALLEQIHNKQAEIEQNQQLLSSLPEHPVR
jgi:ribosomal protein S27E